MADRALLAGYPRYISIKYHLRTQRLRFSLCLRSGDDVTIGCAMHYGTGNCDAKTRKVLSNNSLDIDFIHGDIYDRSCKNTPFALTTSDINFAIQNDMVRYQIALI